MIQWAHFFHTEAAGLIMFSNLFILGFPLIYLYIFNLSASDDKL